MHVAIKKFGNYIFFSIFKIEKMPYKIRKLPGRDMYRVTNSETKEIKAKETTLEKAKAMVKLLNAVQHGWKPNPKYRPPAPRGEGGRGKMK